MQFEPVRDPPTGVHGRISAAVCAEICELALARQLSDRVHAKLCGPLGARSACCSDVGDSNPQDFWRKGVPCLKNRHGVYAYCSVPCRLARSWFCADPRWGP
jgi:hypothetical protein